MTPVKIGRIYYAFWVCVDGYCSDHTEPTRHKASLRTGDKREALARCADLDKRLESERARNALSLPPPNKQGLATLSEYLDDYRKRHQPDKAERTRDYEDHKLKIFMEFVGDPQLKDLDQNLLEDFRRHRLKSVAPCTWNSELKALKSIFGWGLTRRPLTSMSTRLRVSSRYTEPNLR